MNDLSLFLFLLSLFSLLSLHSKNDVTNLRRMFRIIIVLTHAERLEGLKSSLVLGSNLSKSNTGGSFLANELPEESLGSNNAIRNLLFLAKVW